MPRVGSAAPQMLCMQSRIWITLLSDIVDPDPNSVESFRNIGDYLKRHRRLMGDEAGDMRMGRTVSLSAEDVKACTYLLAASNCHRSRAFRTKNSGFEISMQERTSMASKRQAIDPTAVMSSPGHWLRQIILDRICIIHSSVKIRLDRVVALPIQIDDLLTSSRQNPPVHHAANVTE